MIKIEKLTDVVNNPEHPMMQEVYNNFKNNPGDIVQCKKCNKDYQRGIWNFYNLCDPCFTEFNKLKGDIFVSEGGMFNIEYRIKEAKEKVQELEKEKDTLLDKIANAKQAMEDWWG